MTTRHLLSKVPEVTAFFWIIKVLCTTVGETAADFLNVNMNIGLTGTSVIMGVLLAIALAFQFRVTTYIPSMYWVSVVLISVFGTLVTDNLSDNFGVPLEFSTILFSLLLIGTFVWWYRSEQTLSIHSIYTRKREMFYWLTILFTFALGTAAGDLMAEGLGLGYVTTGLIVAGVVGLTAAAWRFGLQPVLSFWIIYILTRPLGASLGDFLTQPPKYGGLGFGVALTSAIFCTAILATIVLLSRTKSDVISEETVVAEASQKQVLDWKQVVVTFAIIAIVSVVGYVWQQSRIAAVTATVTPVEPATQLADPTTSSVGTVAAKPVSPLGDMSSFRTIVTDVLSHVQANDFNAAQTRVSDLEFEWDNAESKLKPKDRATWTVIDGKIDTVLRQIRSTHPDQSTSEKALEDVLTVL